MVIVTLTSLNQKVRLMDICFNGRILALTMMSVKVWASIKVLWRLVSVLPQLSANLSGDSFSLMKCEWNRHFSNIREGVKNLGK